MVYCLTAAASTQSERKSPSTDSKRATVETSDQQLFSCNHAQNRNGSHIHNLISCAIWSYEKASHAPAVIMHVEAGEEAGPACGLSNKLPHAVISVA